MSRTSSSRINHSKNPSFYLAWSTCMGHRHALLCRHLVRGAFLRGIRKLQRRAPTNFRVRQVRRPAPRLHPQMLLRQLMCNDVLLDRAPAIDYLLKNYKVSLFCVMYYLILFSSQDAPASILAGRPPGRTTADAQVRGPLSKQFAKGSLTGPSGQKVASIPDASLAAKPA